MTRRFAYSRSRGHIIEWDVDTRKWYYEDGQPYDAPRAHCDKARADLGLEMTAIKDALRSTSETMIELGLVEPKLKVS